MNSGRDIMLGINTNTVSLLALGAWCAAAGAQTTIHKCVIEGKVSYGDTPCTAGAASQLLVPATGAPDPHYTKLMARQKAYVGRLDAERRAEEIQAERRGAHERRQAAAHRQKCAKLGLRKKWNHEDLARAEGKHAASLRVKARRQAEEMALECPD
ncbi:DUF4124 domain-containing protein [Massilia glaciei]|uniref:DUF4124 domain-containing protein n=1 Tax=Massilia glaciei TaxID=1524097 RepID=UPI0011B23CF2|nr:DUF4124 domain-containing protein [Massilia glaciei]